VAVLQDPVLNERLSTVVVAEIIPHKSGERIFKNEVLLKSEETGLGQDGICALHKILTIDRRLMIAKKSELTKEKLQDVYHAMDVNCGRFRDY
jgi:mRNA-degrading endonuclease toxin of MazEF toxin-antitoxin module